MMRNRRIWVTIQTALLALGILFTFAPLHPALAKHPSKFTPHPARAFNQPYHLGGHLAGGGHRSAQARHSPIRKIKASDEDAHEGPETQDADRAPVLSRENILNSSAERLARVGQHLIVGYHDFGDVKALVENRAIAGIFITAHNVSQSSAASIKAQIDQLQDIRKSQGLPPLIVSADQEGGQVSRLSPPLKKQPSLARVLATAKDDETRRKIVEDYAAVQGAELKRIGVNLNFGPVVDLNLASAQHDDGETRLRQRAIAADPYLVTKAAGWYCGILAKSGVICTLKHFPGLGRVARDTHVTSGDITASEGLLELNDWVPFRRLMDRPNVATMLGHVRVGVIDKSTPASYSQKVIGRLIRETWANDGLLITDDFSMGAITEGKDGVGGAAVKSLNAGTDLILVSFSEKHLDTILSALIYADEKGELDVKAGTSSRERIARVLTAAKDGKEN